MNLFENIQKFGETFYSLRKHDNYFIVDLKFPPQWIYDGLFSKDQVGVKINNQSTEGNLVSFYGGYDINSVTVLENDILKIIKFNKDKEEKNKLLQAKTRELEELFNSTNLEELKSINFNVGLTPLISPLKTIENGRDNPKTEVVTPRDGERQPGNPTPEKRNN